MPSRVLMPMAAGPVTLEIEKATVMITDWLEQAAWP